MIFTCSMRFKIKSVNELLMSTVDICVTRCAPRGGCRSDLAHHLALKRADCLFFQTNICVSIDYGTILILCGLFPASCIVSINLVEG